MTPFSSFHVLGGLALLALTAGTAQADQSCTATSTWLKAQTSVSGVTGGVKPGRCELTFTWSARGDVASGYAAGQRQSIKIRVGLPLSATDGGAGGLVGAWNGKVQNLGGRGLVGDLTDVSGVTKFGYVGSSTDSGHLKGENPNFGVIQATSSLNLGKIDDFMIESLRQQYQWALRLAQTYYGTPATHNYWNGCSTGGRQGLSLALAHAEDFDGFVIGAPAVYHSRLQTSTLWPWWVNKDLAGGSITAAKMKKAELAAVAACDAADGTTDSLIARPASCTYSAAASVCGQPGVTATDCLTTTEAAAIDQIWAGPRDAAGQPLGEAFERGSNATVNSSDACGSLGLNCWAHRDTRYDWRDHPISEFEAEARLAFDVVAPVADLDSVALDAVRARGAKILMWHGTTDPAIPSRQSVAYYQAAAAQAGGTAALAPWFRLYMLPGVGHCGGGKGPQPGNLQIVLEDWVERGVAPDNVVVTNTSGSRVTRSRPMCAWPKVAIYKGSGSLAQASSFNCVE